MKYPILVALLISSTACRTPDQLTVSPYYSSGHSTFERSFAGVDSNESGVMFSLSWSLGKRYEAFKNLAALDVSKAGQLTLRDDHSSHMKEVAPVTVVVEGSEEPEAPGAQPHVPGIIPDITTDPMEALAYLLWALGVLVIGLLVIQAKKAGLLAMFLPGKK